MVYAKMSVQRHLCAFVPLWFKKISAEDPEKTLRKQKKTLYPLRPLWLVNYDRAARPWCLRASVVIKKTAEDPEKTLKKQRKTLYPLRPLWLINYERAARSLCLRVSVVIHP